MNLLLPFVGASIARPQVADRRPYNPLMTAGEKTFLMQPLRKLSAKKEPSLFLLGERTRGGALGLIRIFILSQDRILVNGMINLFSSTKNRLMSDNFCAFVLDNCLYPG